MDAATAIRTRRTVTQFTGEALERPQVEALLELATWAPNHRRSQPWRFYALDQAALRVLDGRLAQDPALAGGQDGRKLLKLRQLLAGAGALVLAGWLRHPDPVLDLEDHAAAAAAVQNLLLAATAAGLGSFWSTNPVLSKPFLPGGCLDGVREGFLGAIFLGRPAAIPAAPPRVPLPERLRWTAPGW